ncbi:dethiobiotin synthetase [Arenibacter nanhaiticus]|uniref:ATP-dependent dethiobiotin synthetase BioD n=1 Tax=Arenibacter nanhaiticus TaxID=558155 RepID=A0A1M6JHU5_9FLAO|nr:dethiobiotin synthase [Arenibacter nanhaiticus]SHJ46220.1 dethiobiotin synthetase [Arenibacter nanhaiticus]
MKQFFVTGISTDVGKTLVAAILTEALEADYWKPVQTGALEDSDSATITRLISNDKTVIHPNSYSFKAPISPHEAAALEGAHIDPNKIHEPETDNDLVIEGAGGLLVPLNDSDTILDLIMPAYKVIVVCNHYLGSINHSLLTINWLLGKGYDVSIVFNGEPNKASEEIILKKTGVLVLGRIKKEPIINKDIVKAYAKEFRKALVVA